MNAKISWVDRALSLGLERINGRSFACDALRYAHGIYPGGLMSARMQRCRFFVRAAWYAETSTAWFAFLDSSDWLRQQVKRAPRLAELLHRPYRRCDLTSTERLVKAVAHWTFVERGGWPAQAINFRHRPYMLSEITCKDGSARQIVLCGVEQFAKEGDACLQLRNGPEVIFTAAFSLDSLDDEDSAIILDIGCLQGPSSKDGRSIVRETTKMLHGIRPRDLLLDSVRAVGLSVGAKALVGVSSKRHIYRHWRKRRHFAFDYDSYWLERGGVRRPDGDYELDINHSPHDVGATRSNKRAEAKRRLALQTRMSDSVLQSLSVVKSNPIHCNLRQQALHACKRSPVSSDLPACGCAGNAFGI